jgi:hypothetical protein
MEIPGISIPSRGRLAQLVRAAGLHPVGRGFESLSAQRGSSQFCGEPLCYKPLKGFEPKALILPLRETSSEAEGFRAMNGAEKCLRRPGARDQDDPERRANPFCVPSSSPGAKWSDKPRALRRFMAICPLVLGAGICHGEPAIKYRFHRLQQRELYYLWAHRRAWLPARSAQGYHRGLSRLPGISHAYRKRILKRLKPWLT